ncbi:Aldose 1-/Glucose-6-phosphate 1-epimerase [Cinnamomum micranthum f. kanehirae]|uniref:Aldose 1-/Glucose-6-phosphate 1-epimerase n=1 Tax=Cinnamomum micranthum f. kanehirae TaxID=337451 RepID=A0A3S3QB15_9MAGN|nr:Aldose 1-/Glucose-6-phosphate 1-epimerase [Cinnamomum micranthum f. kanehirae]
MRIILILPFLISDTTCVKKSKFVVFGSLISVLVFSEVRVEGLETVDYVNNLQNRERFIEQGDALTFEPGIKYMSAHLPKFPFWTMRRREHLSYGRMDFQMLWFGNPWDWKAKAIPYFGDDE